MFFPKNLQNKKFQPESNMYNLKKMAITSINKQNHKFQNLQLLNLTHCRNFYFLKFFFSFFQIFGSYESAFGISWICFEKHPLNKKKGYFEKLACWNIYCYHKKTSQILSPISLFNTKKKEIFAFFFFECSYVSSTIEVGQSFKIGQKKTFISALQGTTQFWKKKLPNFKTSNYIKFLQKKPQIHLKSSIDHRSWSKLQNFPKKMVYLRIAWKNTILKKKVGQLQNFKLHEIFWKKPPNSSQNFDRP